MPDSNTLRNRASLANTASSAFLSPLMDCDRQTLVGEGMIAPDDVDLVRVTDDVEECVRWIVQAREERGRSDFIPHP